jgi:hypothetical protein
MARPETGSVVTVEVFVEQEVVTPVRVLLKLARPPVHRPPAVAVAEEDAGQPPIDVLGDLVEVHIPAGARRTFDGEILAVIGVILQQGADNQAVDGHPDWPTPVRVAAEHAGVVLPWQIRDPVLLVSHPEHVGMLGVVTGDGPESVGAQELLFVEHRRQHAAEIGLVQDGGQLPASLTGLARVVDEGG